MYTWYIRLLQLQFLIVDVIRVLTYVNKQSGYLDPVVSEFFGAGPRFRDSIYSRSDPEIYLQNRSLIKFTSPFSCIKPKINKWLYSYIYIIVIYSQLNVCLDLGEIKIIIIIIEIEWQQFFYNFDPKNLIICHKYIVCYFLC